MIDLNYTSSDCLQVMTEVSVIDPALLLSGHTGSCHDASRGCWCFTQALSSFLGPLLTPTRVQTETTISMMKIKSTSNQTTRDSNNANEMKSGFLLQVKGLSSLEVARRRQANRAQLHLGLSAQSQGPFPRPSQNAGQLQPSRLPQAPHPEQQAGQIRHAGLLGRKPAGDVVGSRLRSIQEKPPSHLQADPAQQARAKLEAIRNELGEIG